MSIIAVKRYTNKIVIAADCQTSWGGNKYYKDSSLYLNSSKLFQDNGLTMGIAGSVEQSNLMKIFAKNHKPKTASEDDVLEFLVEFGDWIRKKDANAKVDNHIILVQDGKIFQCIGLDVDEVGNFNAVGSGMFLAIGAMSQGATPGRAVEVAKEYDLYCGGNTVEIVIHTRI